MRNSAPTRRHASGTGNLNRLLREAVNPPADGKAEIAAGEALFRTGDRVMQIRNNYDILWKNEAGTEAGCGVFTFRTKLHCRMQTAQMTVLVREDNFSTLTTIPLAADENNRRRPDVATGAVRVRYVAARCPSPDLPATAATGGVGDGAGIELTPKAGLDVLDLREALIKDRAKIEYLQGYVRKITEPVGLRLKGPRP